MLAPLAVVPPASAAYELRGDDDNEHEDIGVELRRLREAISFSQLQVAVLCRVDVSTISRWERGRHQHTHRSKDRQIRHAVEVLRWAAAQQEREPLLMLTLEDLLAELRTRERRRQRREP
jgi:transcriptional regulator with XRE-family HTH domain